MAFAIGPFRSSFTGPAIGNLLKKLLENGMYFFIVNPNSGSGSGLKVWNTVKKFLAEIHAEYDVYFTAKQGDAMAKAAEVSQNAAGGETLTVISVGGDGTINEVINGLDFTKNVVFGCIPSGSGNDLCRGLGFPQGAENIARKLLTNGFVREMDYGVLTNADGSLQRRFVVSCGAGFDAAVCHLLEVSKLKAFCNKIGIGKLAYTLVGVKSFFAERPVAGYAVIDGERRVDFKSLFFTSVQNHPYEGGGYKFAPKAQWNDGALDMTLVCSRGKLRLVPILLNKKKGLRENGVTRFYPCREVQFHFEKALPMHADGELMGIQQDITVRCVRGQIRILT